MSGGMAVLGSAAALALALLVGLGGGYLLSRPKTPSDTSVEAGFFRDMSTHHAQAITMAGYVIVGLFVVTWVAALAYWRFARVEERMTLVRVPDRSEIEELARVPVSLADHLPEVVSI